MLRPLLSLFKHRLRHKTRYTHHDDGGHNRNDDIGKQVCPDMGDLSRFKTYEQFEEAVKEEIKYITKWTDVATVISQRVHRDLAPKPLMSIMYEGCMEHGKDVSAGGAMYNFGPVRTCNLRRLDGSNQEARI